MELQEKKILEEIGLSKNEVKVYFGLLELGLTTTTPLAKYVKVPISKIYPTLEKLINKGLVSFIIKNKVKNFQATDPHRIIDILKKKEEEIQNQEKEIESLIPKLMLNKSLGAEKQEATIYEGMNGIYSVYQDVLLTMKKDEEYYLFNLGEQDQYEEHKLFLRNYQLKREQKGIKIKLITDIRWKSTVKEVFKNLKRYEMRFTSSPLPSSTLIYKDKVATILLGENPIAIVVQSKQNAEQYRRFFNGVWEKATLD